MRLVLDTNVLVAAFAARGLCEGLVTACLSDHAVVLSEYVLGEVRDALVRKARHTPSQAEARVGLLRELAEIVEPLPLPRDARPDADDLPVLGTALAAWADALVTGDARLLSLGQVGNVPIISPRQLYDRLRRDRQRHPRAKAFWKHRKSKMSQTPAPVVSSQSQA